MKNDRVASKSIIDRRVARTRTELQHALIALIPERGFEAVTVEEICKKANVGRSTFYAHYTGKEQLRSALINTHLTFGHGQSGSGEVTSLFRFSLPIFEHAQEFRSIIRATRVSKLDGAHEALHEKIRGAVRREIADKRKEEFGFVEDFAVHHVAGAFLAVMAWYVNSDTTLTSSELDGMFQKMVLNGFRSFNAQASV